MPKAENEVAVAMRETNNDRELRNAFPLHKGNSTVLVHVDNDAWSEDFDAKVLSVEPIGDNRYKLTCVPLVTYGLNMHDVVEVSGNGFVVSIVKKLDEEIQV